jgi:hypothetical protein
MIIAVLLIVAGLVMPENPRVVSGGRRLAECAYE